MPQLLQGAVQNPLKCLFRNRLQQIVQCGNVIPLCHIVRISGNKDKWSTIAAENSISPNMLRNWKAEFLENAGRAFDGSRQAKEARRKEADLKKTQAQMLKTIGQLTLERDFLQDCFRAAGRPIPKLPSDES